MCLQKEGVLQIAQPKGAPPLPPFERWSFKERRYIQWLADMHTAHYTLEAAIADAAVVAATEHYGVRLPSKAVECACRKLSAASLEWLAGVLCGSALQNAAFASVVLPGRRRSLTHCPAGGRHRRRGSRGGR